MPRVRIKDWTTKENLLQLKKWANKGFSDKEIAKKIGIDRTTLYRWCQRNQELDKVLKTNRSILPKKSEKVKTKRFDNSYRKICQIDIDPKNFEWLAKISIDQINSLEISDDSIFLNEVAFENYLKEVTKSIGMKCYKNDPFKRKGIPDLLLITPIGTFAYLELKTPNNHWTLRSHQLLYYEYLRKKGRRVEIIHTSIQIKPFLLSLFTHDQECYDYNNSRDLFNFLSTEDDIMKSPVFRERYLRLVNEK